MNKLNYKRVLVILLTLCLTLTLLPVNVLAAEGETAPAQTATGEINGAFVVEVLDNGDWRVVAEFDADMYSRDYTADLGGYANPTVRISKRADGMAILDAVLLDGAVAVTAGDNSAYTRKKLSTSDLDVIELVDSMEFTFSGNGMLVITGRIENEINPGAPFYFDVTRVSGGYVRQTHAPYAMNNYRAITIDGVPDALDVSDAFRVYQTLPVTGHPDGEAWIWIYNDAENLYAVFEWTTDNTYDYGLDFFKVFIDLGGEMREFTQWSDRGDYGDAALTYTDNISYEHMYYEMAIPLAELGNPDNVKLGFSFYGTGGGPTTPGTITSIESLEDLIAFRDEVNSGEYNYYDMTIVLKTDIDLTEYLAEGGDWEPIGDSSSFDGTFDGRGHTISGLFVNRNADNQGLFGYVNYNGTVKNLNVSGSVSGIGDYTSCIGGVAGSNYGEISGCSFTGSVSGYWNVGGVVGYNEGNVTDCYHIGDVDGTEYVGGVVGYNDWYVINCYNSGNVTGTTAVGGVLGMSGGSSSTVLYAYWNTVAFTDPGIGGGSCTTYDIIGKPLVDMKTDDFRDLLNENKNEDCIEWRRDATGVINNGLPYIYVYPYWHIDGATSVPDEVDSVINIENAGQLGAVAAELYADEYAFDGIIIKLGADINLSAYAWYPVSMTGATLDGRGHTISGLFIDSTDDGIGLFGYIGSDGTIKNLNVEGSVNGGSYVGGIVGENYGTVSSCSFTGDVTGGDYVGGLVGENCDGTVQNCYNTGSVTGGDNVGGVVGSIYDGTVQNCYSTGAVTGTTNVGGVVGSNGGTITYLFWNIDAVQTVNGTPRESGAKLGVGSGTNPTTGYYGTEMKSQNFVTFLNAVRTDLNDSTLFYWVLDLNNANGGYPVLTATAPAPTYGISLDKTGTHTFAVATYGYAAQTAKTVTVTNTGNQPTSELTVALGGTNASSFTLSATSINSIAASGTDSFTITPKTGLSAGTYTATVTVSGGANITAQSFTVSFTVNAKDISTMTVTATFSFVTYIGSPLTPTLIQVTFDGAVTTGYTLSNYQNNTNAGTNTASVDITGTGNYTGTATVYFTINPAPLTLKADNKTILVDAGEPTYTYTVNGLQGSDTAAVITTHPTLSVTGFDSSSATTFTIQISGGATTNTNYTITTRTNGTLTVSILPNETTPTAAIDYSNERLTSLTASAAYSINGGADVTANASGTIAINSSWLGTTINIVKKGDGTTSTDSDAQNLSIPARSAVPATPVGGEGQITGVDGTMEYKLSTASVWTAVSGTTVTGLAAGTYNVRVKATASAFASVSASVTVTAPPTYTVTFDANGGTVTPTSAQTGSDGKLTSLPTPARSGSYSFSGWYTAASGGTQVTTSTVFSADTTVYAQWTYTGGTAPAPAPTPTPDPTPGVPTVIVDGKETTAGEVTTEGGKTTVAVNQDVIKREIDNATDNVTIVVPGGTGTAEAQLVVQNIDDMASKDMTLTVQVGDVSYDLPTAAVDTQSILGALGADNPADVPITITITTNMTDEAQAEIDRIVSENGASVVFPPIEFSITATYNGQTVDITEFNQYVSRTVEVTEEQAKQITTAIVVDADGTVRHVPTTVTYDEQTGKWYATINSLTNSTYALVYNEVTFADAQGKWYEGVVNEMGSRMIISGVGDGLFAGERDITRAEFAVIIIQALGLPKNGDGTVFTDVPATAWYAGAVGKAYEYGIVTGIGGGRFAPDTKITRQEAMQMLYNAAQITGFEGSTVSIGAFPDAADISAWALDAVRWNVGSGLVVGAGGQLQPLRNITRAETAALVLKLLQKAGLVDVRTPLTTAQTTNAAAFMVTDPRKEPDPVIVPDDNDEETHDSDDGGTNADAQAMRGFLRLLISFKPLR